MSPCSLSEITLPEVELPAGGTRLLLHCCCAPCSGAIIECLLASGIRPLIFFSNSNIYSQEEYLKRKEEIVRYAASKDLEVVDDDFDHGNWLSEVARGLETAPERGERCLRCFHYRLLRAARYAAANGCDVLTTTLASSRWKDLSQVDDAGLRACSLASAEGNKVIWWGNNWRKGGLQERRNAIIREQQFYNQNYCGCEFTRSIP